MIPPMTNSQPIIDPLPPSSTTALLNVAGLTMRFGGLTAVDSVSFQAMDQQITAIIGPNGAGKTTLFNCLTGFYKPTSGAMTLHRGGVDTNLAGKPAHVITRLGIARTFQNIRLFSNMTALENLLVAEHRTLMPASGYSFGGLIGLPNYRRAEKVAIEKARFWLDRLRLVKAADRLAGELPYGMQRRLEIARAMCTDPALLCLDEPAAGLNPSESVMLRKALAQIRDEHKIGILLIEHNMNVVMEISNHVVVLDYGKRIAQGTPEEVRHDPAVIRAYLGEPDEDAA
jgi:branched-chain amino acid transport system ATP-binding protein